MPYTQTSFWLVTQSILTNTGMEKESIRKVMPLLKATENETLNFIHVKKEELEENPIYSFKPIEDLKLRGTEF